MGRMSETDREMENVLRFVLRRPAKWAARDIDGYGEELQRLIRDLATDLKGFTVYDEFGYERAIPCATQKIIADAITAKWAPYPGHMAKIEEICQGVLYCLRLELQKRLEAGAEGMGTPDRGRESGQSLIAWDSGSPAAVERFDR